ncbi:unnamed protein product [Aspergillus oryzae]|uniref:Unnamed protein product n=1 Tax=Aspergillus oryzae TaxID=5062 RepID=A0AAN4YHN7_ASPOZ|nr:unnamed protein product [Aspergillus oryzae]
MVRLLCQMMLELLLSSMELTPLRLAGVPPPMAHNELILDSNVIDVAFSKSGTRTAVLTKDCFSIFMWSLKTRPVAAPILESSYPLSDALDSRPRQLAFINENEVYILKSRGPNNANIERTTLETRTTKIAYQAGESEQLVSIFPSLNHEALWISHISQYGQPIAYSTISMPSTEEFVAAPALKSILCRIMANPSADMEVPPDTPETDERCRSIERGSRLVSVIPSVFAVVLQAPRGNIETTYPRALVLAGIRSFIDRKNYRSAFLTCRSQMVDMNIIHDYAPEQFMESVPLFIDQVKRVDFIDEFLSRLRYTLYKDTLKTPKADDNLVPATKAPAKGKVNRICDAFLAALDKKIDTNLHNLVTAHVVKSPPDLEAGLQLVARLRGKSKSHHHPWPAAHLTIDQSSEQAEDAVEHMCFLSDAHRLYDTALGLYDLELTLLVAQQAQRVSSASKSASMLF